MESGRARYHVCARRHLVVEVPPLIVTVERAFGTAVRLCSISVRSHGVCRGHKAQFCLAGIAKLLCYDVPSCHWGRPCATDM